MKNILLHTLNILESTTVRVLAAAVLIVTMIATWGATYRPAEAEDAPPAEVLVMQEWLQKNVPEIKRLKAELEPLQEEKDKRVAALEAFNYHVNWETLEVFTLPQE